MVCTAPVDRAAGLELVHQLPQRLLTGGDRRVDDLADRALLLAERASASLKRMFSLPDIFLNVLTSCSVTFFSARAPIRCTVEISNSTSMSVISRSRSCNSAASSVTRSGSE